MTIYNQIGTGYNTTRRADPYLLTRMLHFLQDAPGKKLLDVGCGTGNYTVEIQKRGFEITGVDPAEKMLHEARSKTNAVQWMQGTAEKIPLPDTTVDAVLATLTIHHWKNLQQGIAEVARVLKPGGRFVIFTSAPEQMRGYWLMHYFPHMFEKSIRQMPAPGDIEHACNKVGLRITATEKYFIQDDLQDHFLYVGKNTPEIYFNETLRKGISSFAALSNKDEVESGLQSLRADIEKGKFMEIKNRYENQTGDYLFVIIEK